MNEDFKRFKKRVWRDVFIKCGVAGLASGFFAAAVVLLALKLSDIDLLWVFYLLIGLGGCAVGFGVAFLLLRTDDKKIAKRLDAELGLSERTQTALCYEGASGEMFDAQRNDAGVKLAEIPTKKLPFKNLSATIVNLCVLAVSVCALPIITSTVHAEDVPETPPDKIVDVTDWEWDALDELIAYVKASKKADAYVRAGATSQLEDLRALLVAGVTQSGLERFVRSTASEIRNVVKDANDRGITPEQQSLNTEEGNYIVNRLYEIFKLMPDGDGNGSGNGDDGDDGDDDEKNPGGTGGTGTGKLNIDDTPFFDPEKGGYVKLGEVRDEYYAKAQQALAEGVISQEEWEYIVATYFSDLTAKE
ncbi:MAG: hypothetical protein K2M48_02040 [Clostridiales bacterium]|nr:hypothetical protein [Clostridiales bacterium]